MSRSVDRILVHLYKYNDKNRNGNDEVSFGSRNDMQGAAIERICERGLVETVFLAGGYSSGGSSEPIATRMRDDLIRRGVNKHARIVAVPKGDSTSDEIDLFVAEGRGSIASLGTRGHARRIEMIYGIKGIKAGLVIAEDVLLDARKAGSTSPEENELLDYFANPQNTRLFDAKERLLRGATILLGPDLCGLARMAPVRGLQRLVDG